MGFPIRLSSSPPNEWDGNPADAGHYCHVTEIDGWGGYDLVRDLEEDVAIEAVRSALAAYRVTMTRDREVGILVAFEDPSEGVMYLGIDHTSRTCVEPAMNEAVWTVLNMARDLEDGHRLAGGPASG